MKTIVLWLSVVLVCLSSSAQQVARSLTTGGGLFIGFYEFKPLDYTANPTKRYPAIIFLHGIGERGDGTSQLSRVLTHGIPKNIANGSTMTFTVNGVTESFIVLSPQLSPLYGGWPGQYVDAMMNYAKQNLRVDTNRIFLTGLSLGGGGTLEYITSADGNAAKLAAAASVCPSNVYDAGLTWVNQAQLPVWSFHAIDDPTCPVTVTNRLFNGLNNLNPAVAPLRTLYPNGGHFIWHKAFDESHTYHNPNVYEWFLMQGRGPANQPNQKPIASAGADQVMTLPTNSFTSNGAGSNDPDGTIAMYEWTKIQGPPNFTISNSAAPNTLIKDMIQGTYQFELKVTDYRGSVSRDTMQVVVNPGSGANTPPVANPGSDFSTNASSTFLNGGSSWDPDGYLIAFDWQQKTGPSSMSWVSQYTMFPTIGNMVGGVYSVELTVYDNLGATTKKGVTITNTQAVLPVEYVYVKGKRSSNKNTITWATANEQNSDRFEVERSEDGQTYFVIGKVEAAGFSTAQKNYQFTDEKSPSTKSMYRLRQVDKDGKFKISKTILLSGIDAGNTTQLNFYPNPVKETLSITMNNGEKGKGSLRIISGEGKVIYQEPIEKEQSQWATAVNMNHFKNGMYLVEIKIGDHYRELKQILKQ